MCRPVIFPRRRLPSPLPAFAGGGFFVCRLLRVPLRAHDRAPLRRVLLRALFLGRSFLSLTSAFAPVWRRLVLLMAISRQKTPTATAVGFGSIIICRCSQRTAKRMIQQHTGDNIPIGVNRTVSHRLRYPLLSYQLFQNIHGRYRHRTLHRRWLRGCSI